LIKAMAKVQSQSTSNPNSISQAATIAALTGPQDTVRERARIFQTRRDKVLSMLGQAKGVKCFRPEGAFYIFADCSGLIGKTTLEGKTLATDQDVTAYFLESKGVAAISGTTFGLSPCFRVSYATSTEVLEEACARIQDACARLS
ncbi:MAG TPA: aminotransferase class I/II-fold pyridoxal phosphate-dependent enzyme, partial [Sphingomonadales bacterium]|nr:aminotransferase class I/II-fold pyridoxal phosphate-dependent enzyme [Sphingomonadales bacterium]